MCTTSGGLPVNNLPVVGGSQEIITEAKSTCLQKCVAAVVGIWAVFADAIMFCFKWIQDSLSGYSLEQKLVLNKLEVKAEAAENIVEKMYFTELRSQVASLNKMEDPVDWIHRIEGTAERLEAFVAQVTESFDNFSGDDLFYGPWFDTEAADEFYRDTLDQFARLQDLPLTQVQRALYTGRLTNLFRRMDDLLSDIEGTTQHRYCGCHIQPEAPIEGITGQAPGISHQNGRFNVAHPATQDHQGMPEHASTLILSWSLGGGHNVVQHAMSQRLAEKGAHAYKVEADKEVVEGFYNFRKWTGYTGIEWGDYFLQNGYWRTIRFLSWFSYGKESPSARDEKVKSFVLSLLSRGDQDAAVMCFQAHTCHTEKATNQLGMACYDVATDLDYRVFHIEKDTENPYLRHAVMVADPERQAVQLDHQLEPEQIVEGGFPVREGFLKEYTPEEVEALRQKYADQYGLGPDARVVILLCGGVGTPNTFAETLANHYSNQPDAPPVHLFAICGDNKQKKDELTARFNAMGDNSTFKGSALPRVNDDILGELFAMGALDPERQGQLISAKGGGGTISEAIARGLPTLVCDTTGMPHEQMNIAFLTENNLGKLFEDERDLPALLAEQLQTPFEPKLSPAGESYSRFNSKKKSMDQLSALIDLARNDAEFQSRKPSNIVLPAVAHEVYIPN